MPKEETREIDGYIVQHAIYIGDREIVFCERKDDNDPRPPFMVADVEYTELFVRANDAACDNYLDSLCEFTRRVNSQIDRLKKEKEGRGLPDTVLLLEDCIPNSRFKDYEGKVMVLDLAVLRSEYHSADYQLILAETGFGCSAEGSGRAVYGTKLYTGERVRYNRTDFLGECRPEKLPEWAADRLEKPKVEPQQTEQSTEPPPLPADAFEYGGYHFVPYRVLGTGENTFEKISNRLSSDYEMGLCTYKDKQKHPYSHKDFYAVSTESLCDVFRCVENGKLYLPGPNELFLYKEPPARSKKKTTARKNIAHKNKER